MSGKRTGMRGPRRMAGAGRAVSAVGRRLVGRLKRLILDRAVAKSVLWSERHSPEAHLACDVGLGAGEAERLASPVLVLAADPFHISLKPDAKRYPPEGEVPMAATNPARAPPQRGDDHEHPFSSQAPEPGSCLNKGGLSGRA
jgi:hypothetical protein